MKSCAVFKGGVVDYGKGLLLQEKARALVADRIWDGVLILLEHTPVITIGRSGGRENLLVSSEVLARAGVEVCDTIRGGNVTCHNPGQIIGYPVLDLARWRQDVHWYMRTVEEILIRTLARLGLQGSRKDHHTGVWLADEKVAAIGVYVRKWVTGHGFALNVNNDLSLFNAIIPCGIQDFGVTSLARANCGKSIERVMEMIGEEFGQIFNCRMTEISSLGNGAALDGESLSRPVPQGMQAHA